MLEISLILVQSTCLPQYLGQVTECFCNWRKGVYVCVTGSGGVGGWGHTEVEKDIYHPNTLLSS